MIAVKSIGLFIIIIAVLLSYVVYSYTQDILEKNRLLHKDCPLPEDVCPYKQTLPMESYFGFLISGIIGLTGLYLIFSQQRLEKVSVKEKSKLIEYQISRC